MSILEYTRKPWTPLSPAKFSEEESANARAHAEAIGAPWNEEDEVWMNDEYQATVRYMSPQGKAGVVHLSIKRRDGGPAHDWRDLQAIKNELLGPEREAVELYPAESRLVDQADQTHLWAMPIGVKVEIGFPERVVITNKERLRSMRDAGVPTHKGSQRDWRPGISTGPDYRPGGQ